MSDSNPKCDSSSSNQVGCSDETQLYFAADDVVRILDDYLAAQKAGQAPSRAQLLAQHPQLAAQLEACLAGLDFIHQAQSMNQPHQQLGDFRLIREVGRGGMGAVFEAIQVSLGRRVALKILRFGPASDQDAIERFQREAATVATLHHTNIVPIYFVGSEKGVNYYAMQFIEGRNLAEVIADRDAEILPLQVAAWGLQAAEALAHAHRRGVIHRDVKPSNLILDKEDRLWLTDFGLARRLDDVTLSLTGMLLGTPRYMSPEHARATTKRIDHRSDIFSLGASLYEMLTRVPAFPGEAAHDVIQHILTDEPTPIRDLNPDVPRDLETVVMKCLAKEPGSRYASAGDLAADLRAVLDDRPIRARRASHFELARRWLKQNQRSVSQVSTAAMVTLAMTLTTLLSWTGYASWKMSGVRLGAVNPPLVAEILNEAGNAVRTETLPMQDVASLPAGHYQVRVSAEGTLSQTFDLDLDRGRRDAKYTVNVTDQWLLSPQPIEHTYDVFDTGREQAILLWGKEGVTVHQQHGPPVSWSMTISPQTSNVLADFPGYSNPRPANGAQEHAFGRTNESRPWTIHEFMDVNGDGVGDIICAARHQAWMMAISGTGQGVLWFAGRGRELSLTDAARAQASGNPLTQSSVLYPPLVCDDIDGDGVRDLVVAMASLNSDFRVQQNPYACDRWLEAISSQTGKSIWRYDLPAELFAISANEEVPGDLRWFHQLFRGTMITGGNTMWLGQHHLRSPPRLEQSGSHAYLPCAPQLIQLNGQSNIALAAGTKLLLVDPRSGGTEAVSRELGFRPANAIRWADVDGDGVADMVALEEVRRSPSNAPDPKLVVWSVAKRQQLWSKELDAYWPSKRSWSIAAPEWPLVADLDGDGVGEIIVPDGRSHNPTAFSGGNASRQTPSGQLAVYGGAAGQLKWRRTIVTLDAQVDYFLDGPDIDGDGTREVFAASCDANGEKLFVDAFSGASGKTLWSTSEQIPSESDFARFRLGGVQWWHSGVDGWPQLLVSIIDQGYYSNDALNLSFSAGTGKLVGRGRDLADAFPVDLDRDGIEDLIVCSNDIKAHGSRGSFHCIRGVARQPWKRLAALGQAIGDIDGDGVRDFCRSWGDGTLLATSGATGNEIWRRRAIRAVSELGIYTSAMGTAQGSRTDSHATGSSDLDHDGIDDLIVFDTHISGRKKTPLHAISGKSGKLLWSLTEVLVQSTGGTLDTKIVDVDGDGESEVLWLAAVDYGYPKSTRVFSSSEVQLWLFVASGRDGRLRWAQPLSPAYGSTVRNTSSPIQFNTAALELVTADMNGDRVLDVVAPAVKGDGSFETRVLDGTNGKTLWSRARQNDGLGQQSLENWTSPCVCDLEGDGRPELVLIEPYLSASNSSVPKIEVAVTAVDSAGTEIWSKPTGSVFTHYGSFSRRKGDTLRPLAIQAAKPKAANTRASARPVADRLGEGGKSLEPAQRTSHVVVMLPADSRLLSFDSGGALVERKLAFRPDARPVFALDVDLDGQEDLLCVDRGTLYAMRADNLDQVLWQRSLGELGQQQLISVLPRSDGFPPLVIARTDVTSNTVVALDGQNGQPVWSCPGPIARGFDSGTYFLQTDVAILGGAAQEPSLVCFRYEFVNDCRQGSLMPTRIAEQNKHALANVWACATMRGISRLPAVVSGVASDPRWKRQLPWSAKLGTEPRMFSFLAWGLFFAVTLLAMPVCYIAWLAAKRRFQLSHWLLLPVVAAVFVQAVLVAAPEDNEFSTFPARLWIAWTFSPPILAAFLCLRWMVQKRWRRIGIWLMILLAGSLAMATISIVTALRIAPMIENESFDWSGWYMILLPGAYLTSWLIMLALPLETLGQWFFRRRRRRSEEGHPPSLVAC